MPTTTEIVNRYRSGDHLTDADETDTGVRQGISLQIDHPFQTMLHALETLQSKMGTALEHPPSAKCLFTWIETAEEIRRALAFLIPEMNAAVAELVASNTPQVDVPSAPVVKWSKPSSQWDNEALETAVRRKLVAQAADAGLPDDHLNTLSVTITQLGRVYRLAGSNVRLKILRELDIDPDEYCERGVAKPRVQFLGS